MIRHNAAGVNTGWLAGSGSRAILVLVRPLAAIWSAVRAYPLSHSPRFTAAHREEYGGIEYGGLPVITAYCI